MLDGLIKGYLTNQRERSHSLRGVLGMRWHLGAQPRSRRGIRGGAGGGQAEEQREYRRRDLEKDRKLEGQGEERVCRTESGPRLKKLREPMLNFLASLVKIR